jgi:hypothetical protein
MFQTESEMAVLRAYADALRETLKSAQALWLVDPTYVIDPAFVTALRRDLVAAEQILAKWDTVCGKHE